MVRKTLLSLTLIGVIIIPDIGSAQAGNYDLTGVYNVYHYLVRDMTSSLDDSLYGTYEVNARWPNAANPLFEFTLSEYEAGDTIGPVVVPLVTPLLLGLYGIALNSDIYENGNMIIAGTYPSVSTSDCSTAVTVPAITDNATWASEGDPIVDDSAHTSTFGWGIVTSGVFANNMYPPDLNTEVYGTDYGPGTANETWGSWTSYYNDDFSVIQTVDIKWEQVDGVSSDAGVDTDGNLNGHFGVTGAFGDSSTTTALHAVNPAINVGTYPIIGGSGADLDGDSIPDGVVAAPNLEWGYIFDPAGPDGALFSGDEPLQWTGYYLTFNAMSAVGALFQVLGDDLDDDGVPDNLAAAIAQYMATGMTQTAATQAAINDLAQVYFIAMATGYGVNTATATATAVAAGAYADSVVTSYLALVATGQMTMGDAFYSAGNVLIGYTLTVLGVLGIDVNDSDHDYVQGGNGRLVFQIANSCIPRDQHLSVASYWVNTVTSEVVSDESLIPKQFALHNNYPNPFNPTTQIAVDLPEAAATEITVWNIIGQKVATLYSGDLNAGHHIVNFDGQDDNGQQLTSGMYLYRVTAGKYNAIKKMTLLK
jgi:hypothetical protein